MTTIHYHHSNNARDQVTSGMFGTATALPGNVMRFNPDPSLQRCSTSLRALSMPTGLTLPASDMVELKVDSASGERVLKAVLAEHLLAKWRKGHESIRSRIHGRAQDELEMSGARMQAIPGLGHVSASVLASALEAEELIATQGINALIEGLEVEPIWLRVRLPLTAMRWDFLRDKWCIDTHEQLNGSDESAKPHILSEVTPRTPNLLPARLGAIEGEHSQGWFDAEVDIPFFLPKRRGFLGLGEARAPEGLDAVTAAREAGAALLSNGPIFNMLIEDASVVSAQFIRPYENSYYMDDDDDYDYDDDDGYGEDEDEDGDDRALGFDRPRG